MRRNYLSNCQGITRCIKIRNNVGNIDFLVSVAFFYVVSTKKYDKKNKLWYNKEKIDIKWGKGELDVRKNR